MDTTQLIRDAKYVHACLQEFPDGTLATLKPCKIYIPARFEVVGLADVGVETQILGLAAIVFEDKYYGVLNVNAMLRISPSHIERIKINNVDYLEFHFNAGGVITPNVNLFVSSSVLYEIYNEIVASAKIPWYMSYSDLGRLFDTSSKHAGADIGKNPEVIEIVVAKIARQHNNRSLPYSLLATDPQKLLQSKPTYVPLKSVIFSATNTTTKLAGSYMQHGVISAIVRPTETSERIETLLKL